MEHEQNARGSENRVAEVLGIAALVIAALVTVLYLLAA